MHIYRRNGVGLTTYWWSSNIYSFTINSETWYINNGTGTTITGSLGTVLNISGTLTAFWKISEIYNELSETMNYEFAITWATNPLAPTDLVKIELYKAGVFHSTIIASTVNDGSYTWIIDSALIPTGNDYQIKITHLSDPYVNDLSDYLAIDKEYWTDENGDFVTDENGDPIPQN